ncbi:hypothetical protein HY439_00910 [Candidatus Microgenomates bacterium]|nr:hypothetical protein [Candidatus Microgenomates bacterium]
MEFFSSNIPLKITSIASTNQLGDINLKGDPSGKFLILRSSDGKVFTSGDGGISWKDTNQKGQDFVISSDGGFNLAYATIGSQTEPSAIIYRSSKNPKEKQIYQSGFAAVGIAETIRGIDLEQNKDGLWVLLKDGYSNDYVYRLLYSKDGIGWLDKGIVNNLANPFLGRYFSFTVDDESTLYTSLIDTTKEITGVLGKLGYRASYTDERLTVLRKDKNKETWQILTENLSGNPGEGFGRSLPFENRIFADEEGNVYVIWHDSFFKPKSLTFANPVNFFPSTEYIHRDDIYFSRFKKDGRGFSAPIRINDRVLSYEDELVFYESGTQEKQRMPEDIFLHGMNLKSSVSKNGKYLLAAWNDYREEGKKPIYFSYSKDSGKSWSKSQVVYPDLTDGVLIFDVFIANNAEMHLIFMSKKDNTVYQVSGKIE